MKGGPEKAMLYQSFPQTEEEEDDEEEEEGEEALKQEEEERSVSGDPFVVVKLEDEREGQDADRTERSPSSALEISLFAPLGSSEEEEGEEEEELTHAHTPRACWSSAQGRRDAGPPQRRQRARRKRPKNAQQRRRTGPAATSREESKSRCPGERPSRPVHRETPSPGAALEPPVFPPPLGLESERGSEAQQNVLLEVLSYCRFLAAAVERLEQKIDSLQVGYRNPEISQEPPVAVGRVSWSLAQRLGPSPQPKPLRNPVQEQNAAAVIPHTVGGKKKRRRRRAQRRELKQEAAGDTNEDLQDNVVQKNGTAKRRRKQRKRPAGARPAPQEATQSKA